MASAAPLVRHPSFEGPFLDPQGPKDPPCIPAAAAAPGSPPLSAVAGAIEGLSMSLADGTLTLEQFSKACSLVSVLFNCLGLAFKFAEVEYIAKVNDLIEASKKHDTLTSILESDVKADTVKTPGSHSRNLRRVRLGLDLIRSIFARLLQTKDCTVHEAASMAYNEVFAPFHSWATRTAVSAGMYTLPSREQLIERLKDSEYNVSREMKRYVDVSDPMIKYIDSLFTSRNIALDW